jgi:ariadne-1
MRVPGTYPPQQEVEVIELPHEPPSPTIHRSSTRSRRRDRDRSLERAEDTLAAHLQAQLHLHPTPSASEGLRSNPNVQVYGLGNSGAHHLNESYTVRPLATAAARTAVHRASPRLFGRLLFGHTARAPARVTASTMAGLSRDGSRRGANRVGTWLQHVQFDRDAVEGRDDIRDIDIEEWGSDNHTILGVD